MQREKRCLGVQWEKPKTLGRGDPGKGEGKEASQKGKKKEGKRTQSFFFTPRSLFFFSPFDFAQGKGSFLFVRETKPFFFSTCAAR
jgi:hypothetical protein